MQKASDAGLDLVEVSPQVDPPVCKILDFGKFKYEAQKKASTSKKKQKEMENHRKINCSMKVMSKELSDEIHDRYLIGSNISYNIVSGDVARRGQTGDILECSRPEIERWWNESYDLLKDWNKITPDI